jgi:hypothetical protein
VNPGPVMTPFAGKPVGTPPIATIPRPTRTSTVGTGRVLVTGLEVVLPVTVVAAFAALPIVVVNGPGVTADDVVAGLAVVCVVDVVPAPVPPPAKNRPPVVPGVVAVVAPVGTFAATPT